MTTVKENRDSRFVGRSYAEWEKQALADLAESTVRSYKTAMWRFLEWLDSDTEKLYSEHLQNLNSGDGRDKNEIAQKVKEFYRYQTEVIKFSKSQASQVSKAVKSFFTANELSIEINMKSKKYRILYNGQKIVKKDEIVLMVEGTSSIQKKLVVTTLKDTGLRVSDAVSIQYCHVKTALLNEDKYCLFELVEKKVGVWCMPILGPESMKYVREWIDLRKRDGEILVDDSPLFISTDSETGEKKPMLSGRMSQIMSRLSRRLKLGKQKSAHSLRKFNTTNLQASGMHPAWISIIQGKAIPMSWKEYTEPSNEQLLEAYKNAYKHIAIYEHTSEVNGVKREVREIAERQRYTEDRLKELKTMEELADRLNKLEKMMEDKDKIIEHLLKEVKAND